MPAQLRRRRPRARLAAALVGLAMVAGAGTVAAETVYELAPSVATGATDNAVVLDTDRRATDTFLLTTLGARFAYQGARAAHAGGYRLGLTKFSEHTQADSQSHALLWDSTFNLSARLTLAFNAEGTLTSASRIVSGDFSVADPQGQVGGSVEFLSTGASQQLVFQPNARRRYTEALRVMRVSPIGDDDSPLPSTSVVGGEGRVDFLGARNTLFAHLRASRFQTVSNGVPAHFLLTDLLLGWRRELSAAWTVDLQGGPLLLMDLEGSGVIGPAGIATLSYTNNPWFATFTVSQEAAPNLLLGEATISDRAMARLALPLTKQELYFLTGNVGYVYARLVNDEGRLSRAFDQIVGGVSLVRRFTKAPLYAGIEYTNTNQRGGEAGGHFVPDLLRQSVLITVAGSFVFGPGTPPLFAGRP